MQSSFRLLVALIACCFCLNLIAESEGTPGKWELISTSGGVSLYRRSRPGPGHHESKAIGEIAAPTTVVHAVIDDVDSYPQFMPYTVESKIIKREGDTVIGYQRISAPLVKDRDYTLRVKTTSTAVEGGTSYFSHWSTDNALGPAERSGVVRVNLCEGSWLLEPIGLNSTRATYCVFTDSGGLLPDFIRNIGSQMGIRRIFAAIRNQVRDPKYRQGEERKPEKVDH